MRYWFDTEFIEDGKTIDLISIGIVDAAGRTYYAESSEFDASKAGDWVKANVLRHIGVERKKRAVIAREITEFVAGPGRDVEFWAYFGAYDWVALCQLYGTMMQLPQHWPMFCRDVMQLAMDMGGPSLPYQPDDEKHHALNDALWTKRAWESLVYRKAGYAA